ncbi:hypothetical protein [Paenibacillus alvei]|uniref:hypothetical protein n=1 Tax=Paenibacillus alvei TaxID=44250 RepID=UPI0022815AD3|nr:hypothetical protein [Paenibacillus alvei]
MSMFIVKRDQLEKAIEKTIRTAADRFCGMGGETQLYGIHDGKEIYEFDIVNFAGCSSWNEGDHIVRLYTKEWFNPIEHWEFREELKNELQYDPELSAEYDPLFLAEYPDPEDEDQKYEYLVFKKLLPERLDEVEKQWKELSLDQIVPEYTRDVIERLEDSGEVEVID